MSARLVIKAIGLYAQNRMGASRRAGERIRRECAPYKPDRIWNRRHNRRVREHRRWIIIEETGIDPEAVR